jgi:hypothetical protein
VNLNDAYPSKFLKASDLPDEGVYTVTIELIKLEEIGRDKQTKPVIYFEETQQGLICNKTNGRTIARLLGSEEFDDWIGQKIKLYRTEVDFQGELVDSIRVKSKPEKPAAAKPLATPAGVKRKTAATEVEVDEEGIPF